MDSERESHVLKQQAHHVQTNYRQIKSMLDLDLIERTVDSWYQQSLILRRELVKLQELPYEDKKADFLLNVVRRSSAHYEILLECSDECNPDLFHLLSIKRIEDNQQVLSSQEVTSSQFGAEDVVDRLVRPGSPPTSLQMTTENQEMEINVIPTTDYRLVAQFYSDSRDVYKASSPVRGVALLVCNIEFEDLVNRNGSEHDLTNLSRLFHRLNYNVVALRNCTRGQLLDELDKQRADKSHQGYGSFIFVLSTHCRMNHTYYCSDGQEIHFTEITNKLDNVRFPGMAGKPKILLFEASAGHRTDKGVPLNTQLSAPVHSGPAFKPFSLHLGDLNLSALANLPTVNMEVSCTGFSQTNTAYTPQKMAEKSDFVFGYASFDGYASYRRPSHGCWFSRMVVEVFQKYACEKDIIELLRIVRKKLSQIQNRQGHMQVSPTTDTLTKKFYFYPGL